MPKLNRALLAGCAAAAFAALSTGPANARTVEIAYDVSNFTTPLVIDNPFWPLVSGTTFVYKVETPDGCEESRVTVTSDTKDITVGGETLTVRVVEDLEYEDLDCDGGEPGELVEMTSDWYGQDDANNIWYFGEATFDCEGVGNCVPGGGSWEAGVAGAMPGIIMLGSPRSGDSYRQELAEDVAEDWGMVMNRRGVVRLRRADAYAPGRWKNCLVTKEWNDLEPGHIEQKTYCPGIGLVLVEEHHGKVVRFELVSISSPANPLQFRVVP